MPHTRKQSNNHFNNGFTLVEVLIAGAIMASTMIGIARFSSAALAISSNQKDRQALEATINNNIQLIQQSDSQITENKLKANIFSNTLAEACSNPAQFLIEQISETGDLTVQQPELLETKVEYNLERKEQVLNISTTGSTVNVMEVTYEFDSPEESFGKETRIFEISPTFSSACY